MKILVTGASGFLGLHLCNRLLADGHDVTAMHRSEHSGSPETALDVPVLVADVRDAEAISRGVRGFDAVIHAAASIAYWPPNQPEQEAVNVGGPRNIAAACRANGIGRLIHVSSVAALGIPMKGQPPANESFRFNLEGKGLTYHESKHRGEATVREQVSRGLDAVIVNPGWIFGPDPRGYRGWQMLDKCINKRVAGYFPGGISPVHVDDVVTGIIAALTKASSGDQFILAGQNITFRELVRCVAARTGSHPLIVPVYSPVSAAAAFIFELLAKRTGSSPRITRGGHLTGILMNHYSSDHARRALGYDPRNFDVIVDEALAWADARKRARPA